MLTLALVVLKDKIVVLGPGLGIEAQVLVNIPAYCALAFLFQFLVYSITCARRSRPHHQAFCAR